MTPRSLFLAVAFCCSAQIATAEPAPPEPADDTSQPLAAGVYHLPGHFSACVGCEDSGSACVGCTSPRAAIITGIYSKPEAARRALKKARSSVLPLGYPFAAHTEELFIPGKSGIAVVIGLFETQKAATKWQKRNASRLPTARVVTFAAEESAGEPERVVQIGHRPAHAYAEKDVEEAMADGRRRQELKPLCTLQPGSLYVLPKTESQLFHQWVPARCGKQRGYVFKIDTLLDGAVVRQKDGSFRFFQVTYVICDGANIDAWHYTADGRKPLEKWSYDETGTESGPCDGDL